MARMTAPISLDALAQSFARAFPDLERIAPLRVLGEGFSSTALETADGVIFRLARHAQAGAKYAREARILAWVGPFLPVAVPEPRWHAASSADFPFGVIGYRKLPGQPLEPDVMDVGALRAAARQIGEIIAALQRVPNDILPPPEEPSVHLSKWRRMRAVSAPALKRSLAREEYQNVQDWWEELLADEHMHRFAPVFAHGDLWYGNMLAQAGRITGLLDFEEAGLGDPAQDFVPQLYLGERFLEWVLEAFQSAGGAVDAMFSHRLRRLWALREFTGLVHAIEQDPTEFADAIDKLRRGPILSPRGLDGWGRL